MRERKIKRVKEIKREGEGYRKFRADRNKQTERGRESKK